MDLFHRPRSYKIIISSLFGMLGAALIGFIILLINDATKLSNVRDATTVNGPFGMYELAKSPLATGGYEASMHFTANLVWYGVIALAIGVVISFIRLQLAQTPGTSVQKS